MKCKIENIVQHSIATIRGYRVQNIRLLYLIAIHLLVLVTECCIVL